MNPSVYRRANDAVPYLGCAVAAHLIGYAILPQPLNAVCELAGSVFLRAVPPPPYTRQDPKVNDIEGQVVRLWVGMGCKYLSLGCLAVGLYKLNT